MDILTHIPDLTAFRAEALAHAGDEASPAKQWFSLDDEGTLSYSATKIPVHYSGNESVCLIRVADDSSLTHITTMNRLGVCEGGQYVFDSPEAQATYERLYDTKPRMVNDEEGNQMEYTPPYMIGVFA